MLSAAGLTRRFGARVAVDDVSFEIGRGEIFALLGPNGAGKTTTLRLLSGLISPSSGEVRLGTEVLQSGSAPALRSRIGLLTEAPGLWERLTVGQNLLTYARLYGLSHPARVVQRALELFDLEERISDTCAQLSKGLKQRVALARTLLHNPDIVLLDEPTSGLDPESASDVRRLIVRLRDERRAVLLSTHNLDEVERLADRVAVLRSRLIALDTPDALRAQLFDRRVRVRVRADGLRYAESLRSAGAEVVADETTISIAALTSAWPVPAIVKRLVELGAEIESVVTDQPSLEDVYLRLVRGREVRTP
jgi:ABC-2 type transport system ATP-binding protein